ncbi:rhodanese domain-containing protein CG4456-like isoform X3 [Periplaneta americana]|uniref:rhodanese domain-containing protein CG4456-like isoform X3 n=1 Tax=Periplaneta americana TaxID=6978 RepID=UPI0037E8B9E9
MANRLVRSLLPVVSKVKFYVNIPKHVEKCCCVYPKKIDSFRPIKIRSMASTPASGPAVKDLAYDDVVELKRKNEIILIDVREPSEIKETGKLPGSVHIPLGDVKNALESLSPEEFLKMYGIEKPKLDANLVFSCRSGKRSRSAMETAMSIGFLNSRHYDGGFLDWQKHHPA